MFSSFVETQMESVPLRENIKRALCTSSHLFMVQCKNQEQRVINEHFPSSNCCTVSREDKKNKPEWIQPTFQFTLRSQLESKYTIYFGVLQGGGSRWQAIWLFSHIKYFIPRQQQWRRAGRINSLKCRTGISRWRKRIHNQKSLLRYQCSCFTFNSRWSQGVFTVEKISHSRRLSLAKMIFTLKDTFLLQLSWRK